MRFTPAHRHHSRHRQHGRALPIPFFVNRATYMSAPFARGSRRRVSHPLSPSFKRVAAGPLSETPRSTMDRGGHTWRWDDDGRLSLPLASPLLLLELLLAGGGDSGGRLRLQFRRLPLPLLFGGLEGPRVRLGLGLEGGGEGRGGPREGALGARKPFWPFCCMLFWRHSR